MREFDLNIERVLENWTVAHALREVIANALDEQALTGTREAQIFRDAEGRWHIRDWGRGLRYEHLTQNENKEKLAHPDPAGGERATAGRSNLPGTSGRCGAVRGRPSRGGRRPTGGSPRLGHRRPVPARAPPRRRVYRRRLAGHGPDYRRVGSGCHALKVAVDDAAAARIADEAGVLAGLTGPRLARLIEGPLDVGGRQALVLESAGEETLGEVLRGRERLSLDLLERWGTDLLEALVALDRAGVDHRDIKPANLGVREPRLPAASSLPAEARRDFIRP
jgi:hypothetical protein